MARISFLALNNCFFSGINYLLDAFTIVNNWHQYKTDDYESQLFDVEIVTTDVNPVTFNGLFQINPHRALNEVEDRDLLMIPGIQTFTPPFSEKQDFVLEQINQLKSSDIKIAAGCTGVFLLAQTGLLNRKLATTNWRFAKPFRQQFPEVNLKIDEILTEDDGLICAGATSAFLNLGLHIIQTYCSNDIANHSAKFLLIDPRQGSQTPYMIFEPSMNHGDQDIVRAQKWMKTNFAQEINIDTVANHVNISSRHFKRRFKNATGQSPLFYLQNIRVESAKKRLETTLDTINEITYQIGYSDSSTFRRLFKKHVGLSPREYRDKFMVSKLQ